MDKGLARGLCYALNLTITVAGRILYDDSYAAVSTWWHGSPLMSLYSSLAILTPARSATPAEDPPWPRAAPGLLNIGLDGVDAVAQHSPKMYKTSQEPASQRYRPPSSQCRPLT